MVAWGSDVDGEASDFFSGSLPNDPEKSIIRKLDSQTKMFASVGKDFWEVSETISPTLPNDVVCAVRDSEKSWSYSFVDEDNDYIPDCSEKQSSTYFGLDLYYAGAREGTMDLIAEVDYMETEQENIYLPPTVNSLKLAAAPFDEMGVKVHFDVGDLLGNDYNLFPNETTPLKNKSGGNKVPEKETTTFFSITDPDGFMATKREYFDFRKKNVVHYILKVKEGGGWAEGAGGIAEIYGNDNMIAMHSSMPSKEYLDELKNQNGGVYAPVEKLLRNFVDNLVGLTIAHELGHNVGFGHSGGFGLALDDDDLDLNEYDGIQLEKNYEINYPSLMNYLYIDNGVRKKEPSESTQDYIKNVIAPHYYRYIFANKTFEVKDEIDVTKTVDGKDINITGAYGTYFIFDLPSVVTDADDRSSGGLSIQRDGIQENSFGYKYDPLTPEELEVAYEELTGESFPSCLVEMYKKGYDKILATGEAERLFFFSAGRRVMSSRLSGRIERIIDYSFDSSIYSSIEDNNVSFSPGYLVGEEYQINLNAANEKKVNIDFNCDGDFEDEFVDVFDFTKYDEGLFLSGGLRKVADHSDHDDQKVIDYGRIYDKDSLFSARPIGHVFLSVDKKKKVYAKNQVSTNQNFNIIQNFYIDRMPEMMKKLKESEEAISKPNQ